MTAQNVHNYVRKYAEHRMMVVAEKALKVSPLSIYICPIGTKHGSGKNIIFL